MMTFFESPLFVNFVYLVLIAGIWLATLALLQPGTGALEVAAVVSFILVGLSTLVLPLNVWAVLVLVVGAIVFIISLRGERPDVWLVAAAIIVIVGTIFLFWTPDGGIAVNPVLATIVSVLTLGYYWLAIRSIMASQAQRPTIDATQLLGKRAEVRTAIDPMGSVYLEGELWTARSDIPIDAGSTVTVRDVDGLVLRVEPADPGS
jgi:membrane-bound serine protease (ClpP class)